MRSAKVVSLTKRFKTLWMMVVYIGNGIQRAPAIHCLVDSVGAVSSAIEGMMRDRRIVGMRVLRGPIWRRRLSAAW